MRRALAALGAVIALTGAGLGVAGCGGGVGTAPPGDAAAVVPADALAYLHVDLGSGGAAGAAAASAATLPGWRRLLGGVEARLEAIAGAPLSRIRPWLGDEAAVAFLPDGASAQVLVVLGVRRPGLARSFAATRPSGVAARVLGDELVLGSPGAVSAAAAARSAHRSLATTAGFRAAVAADGPSAVLSAYGTGTGVTELLGGRGGAAGVLADLLTGASQVSAALSPTGDGFELTVQLPGRPAGRAFTPSLLSRLPAATAWAVDLPGVTASAPGLLGSLTAAVDNPVSGLLGELARALRAQGVATAPLLARLRGQGVLFGLDGGVGLLAATPDPAAGRLAFAAAGPALAELFAPSGPGGLEPVVATRRLAGVAITAFSVGDFQVDLAAWDGALALTTSAAAMDALVDHRAALPQSSAYASVLGGTGRATGPVLFGAVDRFAASLTHVGLRQSLGLSGDSVLLTHITAAGLTTHGGPDHTTAELFITIP